MGVWQCFHPIHKVNYCLGYPTNGMDYKIRTCDPTITVQLINQDCSIIDIKEQSQFYGALNNML